MNLLNVTRSVGDSLTRRGPTRLSTRCDYSCSSPRGLAKILASDPIDPICAKTFSKHGHELVEMPGLSKTDLMSVIEEYDGLVVRTGTKRTNDILSKAKNLKVIGRAGTGVDNIDVSTATNLGMLVVNTPGGNTVSTGELAMSHILSLARNIPQATAALKDGRWERSKYTGTELSGKTLGVIGIGRIGREVTTWARGFGMSTIGYDPVLSATVARENNIEPVSLEELYAKSDFITIHSPLTKETADIINSGSISKMKDGVRIVNCARGGIVNEADLLEALDSGKVGGAALDVLLNEPPVPESEALRKHPNTVFTPHLGASTSDAQVRVAEAIATNMSNIFNGGDFVGVINAPDVNAVAKLPHVVPYVMLAEKIGAMQAQLLGKNKVNRISVKLTGKTLTDSKAVDVLKSAVLKGLLGELITQQITYVNAISIAEHLGVKTTVSTETEAPEGYPWSEYASVTLETEGNLNFRRTIEGVVFGRNELRVTKIDGLRIDLPPGANMLLFNNVDAPGVLRRVADKLAAADVNLEHFSLGRSDKGSDAMCAMVLGSPVPRSTINELEKFEDVSNVTPISLKQSLDPTFVKQSLKARKGGTILGRDSPPSRPANPEFSSGPCKKRPGYSLSALRTDALGRSHRSALGKGRLRSAIERTREMLGIPHDYLVGIVPASDTGAYEMAMWNMLGQRPIDACHWESFGKGWHADAIKHLGLSDSTREFTAEYGHLPDLASTSKDHDIMFTFNGTTAGVRVPNLDWISDDRTGLTFNDATSAAFAMHIDWSKVDVTTYSWQKVLGGEGAHGVLILSPRAVERLETFVPSHRPLPKIFRMTKGGKVDRSIFEGATINTPSMLCVEDYHDALDWADSIGGLNALVEKSERNLGVLERYVSSNEDWLQFLCQDKATRSSTSICLTMPQLQASQVKKLTSMLEEEGVAFDIGAYRDAPAGLRIWGGATVEEADLESLMPWLKWAHDHVKDS